MCLVRSQRSFGRRKKPEMMALCIADGELLMFESQRCLGNSAKPVFRWAMCAVLLAGFAQGQTAEQESAGERAAQSQSEDERAAEVAKAIARLKSGNEFGTYTVEVIREARAVEGIPDLEKQFTRVSDPLVKAKIAQVLLSFGVRKEAYWNYLAESVQAVLDTNVPDPTIYNSQGKQVRGLSADFVAWARSRGESPGKAAEDAVYIWPGFVMLVGASGDARAIPLLRRALSSGNLMIQDAAAMGLAEMQDLTSVPTIIAKCKAAPPEVAAVIAESLVFFDDPRAQAAVDAYVPTEIAKALRERKRSGKGPLHGR